MQGTLKDITGQKFGRLTAIRPSPHKNSDGRVLWECLCDCGKEALVSGKNLRSGNTRSCGCLNIDSLRAREQRNDLTGKRFGRLVVVSLVSSKGDATRWSCLCDCGRTTDVLAGNLNGGSVRSCGCLAVETAKKIHTTHGMTKTQAFRSWASMIKRCTIPTHKAYKNYGGRGISVCNRWMKFENFFIDMGEPPDSDHSLDRIDNDAGYEPGNCRWATRVEQSNNRRTNRSVTYNGETKTVTEWSRIVGVSSALIFYRINNGWSIKDALETPSLPHGKGQKNHKGRSG